MSCKKPDSIGHSGHVIPLNSSGALGTGIRQTITKENKLKYLLLGLLSLVLVGCSPEEEIIVSETVVIEEDQYIHISFVASQDGEMQISYNHRTGPAVEAYVLDQNGYNIWLTLVSNSSTSQLMPYLSNLSSLPLASQFVSGWVDLPEGTYHIIVENTDYGSTSPPFNGVNDVAAVEVSVYARK